MATDAHCYVCLESGGKLVHKTCACKLLVHPDCWRREMEAMDRDPTRCRVCQRQYAQEWRVHCTPLLVAWIVMVVLLLIDELILIVAAQAHWMVGTVLLICNLAYAVWLTPQAVPTAIQLYTATGT